MIFFALSPERTFNPRERVLMRRLEVGYTPEILSSVLEPLIARTSPVSLRLLDWAVVNWSKQHNVICSGPLPGQTVNVHHAYHTMLHFWKRVLFDPFRRRLRVGVLINGTQYETTLGQANFALFVYKTGILSYVLGNIEAIEEDMNRVSRLHKKHLRDAKTKGCAPKRSQLTRSHSALCAAYAAPARIEFD